MIKRIVLATRPAEVDTAAIAAAWRDRAGAGVRAPQPARPARIAICTSLPDVIADPRHDVITLEWFDDGDHVERYEAWRSTQPELDAGDPVVVADEHAMRGGAWLARRWRDGGTRLKHMALACRASGLSPADVAREWERRAGTAGGTGAEGTVIPEDVRGLAYVQNRPVARADGEWTYDALNEVWFDDVDDLRRRVDWFGQHAHELGESSLFGATWFVAVREEVLFDRAWA